MSYEIDGEQYISVNVGWGGAFALVFGEFVQAESLPNVSRVLTFKLGANEKLPDVDWQPRVVFDPPEQQADAETIRRGHRLYQDTCMGCHGLNAVSGLLVPDLRASAFLHDEAGWEGVVRLGLLRGKGMPEMGNVIDVEESEAIRAYVIQEAWRAQRLREGS